jgi:zinc protease
MKLLERTLCAGAVWMALAGPAGGAQQIHEHRLANGMRVLIKEDRRAPVAVSMLWYRTGSIDETSGTTGVAHVLEHMMFKGTKSIGPGEFSRSIARAGGRDNAFTNKDATAYHQQLHKAALPLALELEADRMANLVLTDEEFTREMKVVMEERRLRTEDQPRALLYEAFYATAYAAHPYRTPVVGWMGDLEDMRTQDARDWYGRWYAPNNATLVVLGDVDADEVLALAKRHFEAIPPRALPERKAHEEPPQRGMRRLSVRAPAELPYVLMGWHVPSLREVDKDWEPYALAALAAVLDGSEAARLQRALVRESRVAVSAGAHYDAINRGPALFMLSATPSAGRSVEEGEAALREQIRRIAEHGVSEDELARVKAQVVAAQAFRRDSMFGQAMAIGALDNAGLPPDSNDLQAQRLQAVTSEQIRAVARKHLVDDNLTVAVLEPLGAPGQSASAAEPPR